MSRCEGCGHAVEEKKGCRFCVRRRRVPPCTDAACLYCTEHSLHGVESPNWNDARAPRQVWRTSSASVEMRCVVCTHAYTTQANRIGRGYGGCPICPHKTESKLYAHLRETCGASNVLAQFTVRWDGALCKYDFRVGDTHLVELDGLQHFRPIPGWQTGFELMEKDRQKEEAAVRRGFAVLRLTQHAVSNDVDDWKDFLQRELADSTPGVRCHGATYDGGVYRRLRSDATFF